MGRRVDQLGHAAYSGLWSLLETWLRTPRDAVTLPPPSAASDPDSDRSGGFRPDPGFLSYLKAIFWVGCIFIDLVLLILWIVIVVASPLAGAILLIPFLVIMIVPDLFAYVAVHLRYDTTWYAMNERSMRIRRGVIVIRESTITFENVQNVTINRGPLEQYFGIGRVIVETAGGGGGMDKHGRTRPHVGIIEGLENPEAIRDLVMTRVRTSKSAGLGDEETHAPSAWSPEHTRALREIRDAAVRLADA